MKPNDTIPNKKVIVRDTLPGIVRYPEMSNPIIE